MSVNKVILIGNVGADPVIRTTQDGKKIATFSLATSEKWKDRTTNEWREKTEWHKIVIFSDGLANVVEKFVQKGTRLYVEGALQTRKWTDKKDNVEKYATEVILQGFNNKLEIIESKKGESEVQEVNGNVADNSFDPDIPF
jgi:single-strand DNA-binding protein